MRFNQILLWPVNKKSNHSQPKKAGRREPWIADPAAREPQQVGVRHEAL